MNGFNIVNILPKPVHLNQIDEDPGGACCMSYGFDVKRLSDSIGRIGLINAPVLMGTGEGDVPFRVVAGFKRIMALKTLGMEGRVPCRILHPETTPLTCLLINLYENLTIRDFNPVEKGMALARLLQWLPAKEVINTFMPLFDLPSHEETLHLFVEIATKFEPRAKDLLVNGNLSIKGAKHLLEMDAVTRGKLCGYFSVVKFSKNQQGQFIEFLKDLSHIEKKSVEQLLDDPRLVEIRDGEAMNPPQKARALMKVLRARRLPRLVQAEKGFRRMVERLALPAHYRITSPPFFEGPDYRLDISFKNGGDLMEKLSILLQHEGIAALEDPWHKVV